MYSIFVNKEQEFDAISNAKLASLKKIANLNDTVSLKIVNHYLIDTKNPIDIEYVTKNVLSEVNIDDYFIGEKSFDDYEFSIAIRPLVGQFDLRAKSAQDCIAILTGEEDIVVKTAIIYNFNGNLNLEDKEKIESLLVNSLENEKVDISSLYKYSKTDSLIENVKYLDELVKLDDENLETFIKENSLAMSKEDLKMIIDYFKSENRVPTEVELKVLDTYWSDHCRHTTFNTKLSNTIDDKNITNSDLLKSISDYHKLRKSMNVEDEPITLMELATLYTKYLYKNNKISDLDVSEEINACSINVPVTLENGEKEDMLLMFKNETHNHPTEIEPFGGAATCLGGAIRDPLSGRAYVYGAMRITGAENPKADFNDTIKGKLPQYKICRESARGYSSYGNQMGIATGLVKEFYHSGFLAKRMEVGAVIASAKKENVIREIPENGDVVILVGGRTGRDGVGGATGSSKLQDENSLIKSSSEVQKGNAVEERKIIRLFMNPNAAKMIKRCNDFGAGGVAVAVGEIAKSIDIDLNKIIKKYDGLNAVELAISESQERMAVVIAKENVSEFQKLASLENLEATVIAKVTDTGRVRMNFNGKTVFDITRNFIESNGADRNQNIKVNNEENLNSFFKKIDKNYILDIEKKLKDIKNTSQKGLVEMFDSSIGGRTVTTPMGGKNQITESDAMIHFIPVGDKNSKTMSLMTFFYDPELAEKSSFYGAYYAVLGSIARTVASGFDYKKIRLTFQEYFEKLGNNPEKWAKPLKALLGAFAIEKTFEIPAIGGKDSMSGTYENINVPPTLISFAVSTSDEKPISNVLKEKKSYLYMTNTPIKDEKIDLLKVKNMYDDILKNKNNILSMKAIDHKGFIIDALEMAFGNGVGLNFNMKNIENINIKSYGSILIQSEIDLSQKLDLIKIADINDSEIITFNDKVFNINKLLNTYKNGLDSVYEIKENVNENIETLSYDKKFELTKKETFTPTVFIPVFPGTNCEHDTKRAFEKAGANVITEVFRNLSVNDISNSIAKFVKAINKANIIAIPGGFSAGDEPEGSAKFIATVFRNDEIKKAINDHLNKKDGLIIGICNGFQALIKLGLFENDIIKDLEEDAVALTYNKIHRHVSKAVKTRISSVNSPWLTAKNIGDINSVYVSNGEGRIMLYKSTYEKFKQNGQIFSQYVDEKGFATMDGEYNPSSSMYAIEGLISKSGRVLGKMGHTERAADGLYINYNGNFDNTLFKAGVDYFKEKKIEK